MASAVDAVLDEGESLGEVVDEYFSFIYDETTDEGVSEAEESETDGVGRGSSVDNVALRVEDPIYQNLRRKGDGTRPKDTPAGDADSNSTERRAQGKHEALKAEGGASGKVSVHDSCQGAEGSLGKGVQDHEGVAGATSSYSGASPGIVVDEEVSHLVPAAGQSAPPVSNTTPVSINVSAIAANSQSHAAADGRGRSVIQLSAGDSDGIASRSHTIYVNGDAPERSPRATSVYLTGHEATPASEGVAPDSGVTIQVCEDLGCSDADPFDVGRFLEEVHKPHLADEARKSQTEGGSRFLLEATPDLVRDSGDRVINIGAIECEILDELFEDMMLKEAKMNPPRGAHVVDRSSSSLSDDEARLRESPIDCLINGLPRYSHGKAAEGGLSTLTMPASSPLRTECADRTVALDVHEAEFRGLQADGKGIEEEECSEALVESWKYVPGDDASGSEWPLHLPLDASPLEGEMHSSLEGRKGDGVDMWQFPDEEAKQSFAPSFGSAWEDEREAREAQGLADATPDALMPLCNEDFPPEAHTPTLEDPFSDSSLEGLGVGGTITSSELEDMNERLSASVDFSDVNATGNIRSVSDATLETATTDSIFPSVEPSFHFGVTAEQAAFPSSSDITGMAEDSPASSPLPDLVQLSDSTSSSASSPAPRPPSPLGECSWHERGEGDSGARLSGVDGGLAFPELGPGDEVRPSEGEATEPCPPDNEDNEGTGLAAAMSRVVRRSMRRMRRLRLSGRRSPNRGRRDADDVPACMSEETEGRRCVPSAPAVGLPTVRSPAAASIIVTSLVAALAPPPLRSHPREVLDPPPPGEQVMSVTADSRPDQPEVDVAEGERRPRRPRHHRAASRGRNSSSSSSSAPQSLEVEVGGYAPSAPPSAEIRPQSPLATAPPLPVEVTSSPPPPVPSTHPVSSSSSSTTTTTTTSTSTSSSTIAIPRASTTSPSRSSTSVTASIPRPHITSPRHTATTPRPATAPSATDGARRGQTQRRHQRRRGDTNNNNSNNNNNNNNNRSTATPDRTTATTNTGNTDARTRNNNNNNNTNSARASPRRNAYAGTSSSSASSAASFEAERLRVQGGSWTHGYSGLMSSLAVTVTTFNISRFAVLGARFGWPFVVQWGVISLVLGLPLMTFHMTVGQYLGAGVVDMWRISPIFQGVGYSLAVAQALLGVYCCVPIAWLFIYFRDSFITHNNMFRWADCRIVNCSVGNYSILSTEGVPKYFNTQVLQRSDDDSPWLQELGSLKFDMAFNIALIWIFTLIALSRGNQTYGKVCYIIFLLPLLCYMVVCLYLVLRTKDDLTINYFTNFNELFMNSRSWMAASREVFLVWGLHGSVLQQMSAHNKRGHALYRDTTIVSVVTTLTLVLAAVTGSSCVSGLQKAELYYKPSSFERTETAQFLSETPPQHSYQSYSTLPYFKKMPSPPSLPHDNFYAGIRIREIRGRKENHDTSGYQSLRLATELFPALLGVNSANLISPFWSSLFYLSLLLFGIAQQLAVWRTVVEAVIRINQERLQAWETFITFLCCVFGFSAALPMATGAGIHILYFLDYVVSSGWWLMIIQLVQIFALLFVRGKPYSGQDIVGELMGKSDQCRSLWLGPLTSFAWNIIVPVGLLVLSISSFKSGQFRDVFAWGSKNYWPPLVCQLASAIQLFPILLVPLVGLIQTCRYLAATDDDLFERIQLLYRPSLRQRTGGNSFVSVTEESSENDGIEGSRDSPGEQANLTPRPYSDPPPKYTPPPSYSTATGVRFAKLINQSLRQSMRRLRDTLRSSAETTQNEDAEATAQSEQCQSSETQTRTSTPYIPPPDYVTAVSECATNRSQGSTSTEPPPRYSTLDPLRRQQALAALGNSLASGSHVKVDGEAEQPLPATNSELQRDNSLRRSGLRRSIASGVRRSARRLAATLGVGVGEDGANLVNSEVPLSQDSQQGRENEDSHPYAFTNFELVSQSDA